MADLVVLASALVRIASVVLAPILLLYVAVAWHGARAKASREERSELWMLLLFAAGVGLAELMNFVYEVTGIELASLAASVVVFGLLVALFLTVRTLVHAEMRPHVLAARKEKKTAGAPKAARRKKRR